MLTMSIFTLLERQLNENLGEAAKKMGHPIYYVLLATRVCWIRDDSIVHQLHVRLEVIETQWVNSTKWMKAAFARLTQSDQMAGGGCRDQRLTIEKMIMHSNEHDLAASVYCCRFSFPFSPPVRSLGRPRADYKSNDLCGPVIKDVKRNLIKSEEKVISAITQFSNAWDRGDFTWQ